MITREGHLGTGGSEQCLVQHKKDRFVWIVGAESSVHGLDVNEEIEKALEGQED